MINMNFLFKLVMNKGASDIHLTVNAPPILRIDGILQFTNLKVLSSDELKHLIYSILNDEQKAKFESDKELDISFSAPGLDRFRINVHYQKGNVEAAFRRIPYEIPTIEKLGIPLIAYDLIRKPNGLVLVTGPTGNGKSTTLAAMIDVINNERAEMIDRKSVV